MISRDGIIELGDSMKELLQLDETAFTSLTSPYEQISYIQQQFAKRFTFENLDVLLGNEEEVTEAFLKKKILTDARGGLCFELNGALHLVLKELGFDVCLGVATVWGEDGWIIDKTHRSEERRVGNERRSLRVT